MRTGRLLLVWMMLATCLLTSCSSYRAHTQARAAGETIPTVSVRPNSSGLEVGRFRAEGPRYLIGGGPPYTTDPPDVSSGVSARVRRVVPLHNKEPRYFIAASGWLQIVSVERIENYDTKYHSATKTLQIWRNLLADEIPIGPEAREILYQKQLSEIPWINAGRGLHAKLRYRVFPWGKAAMFLAYYNQGPTRSPINNDMLVLVVQGFTNDGRYAVKGHFEIHHDKLPDNSNSPGGVRFSMEDKSDKAEKWFDAQADSSFHPSFSQYDTFLEALEIEPGRE